MLRDDIDIDTAPQAPVVRVFGGVGVADENGPVSIGGPRQRRLLALLAIRNGELVDLDWLVEYLWDDDDRPGKFSYDIRNDEVTRDDFVLRCLTN